MCYYVHFTALLHVSYCFYFHYMYPMYITWLSITGVLLLRLSQSMLTDTDSCLANYRCKHVQWDCGTPWGFEGQTKCFLLSEDAGPLEHSLILYESTLYASVCMDTEHCIMTVLLHYVIVYKIGMKHRHKHISKCF